MGNVLILNIRMHQEKNTHSDQLRGMLHKMMKSNELTDITLISDDKKKYKAHKIVLSACSTVFKSIINNLPQNNSVIYLRGIQHEEMESILQFMYLGVATVHQDNIDDFLNVAKNLEIKEIGKDFRINDSCIGDDKLYSAVYESEVEKDDKEITDRNISDNKV